MDSYLGLGAACVLLAVVLFCPGVLALRLAGLPWLAAWAAAPAIGVMLVVLLGLLAHLTGVSVRSAQAVTIFALLVTLSAIAGRWAGRLLQLEYRHVPQRFRPVVLAWVAAAVTFGAGFLIALGSPEAWPQMPDNIFHVGAVTWMERHGSVWIGDVPRYSGLTDSPFAYPGAWHALAALASLWTGAPALVASHALVLVVAGLVWPAAVCLVAWKFVAPTVSVTLTAAACSLAIYGMPYHSLSWGMLWPYFLAASLLPVVWWCTAVATRSLLSRNNPAAFGFALLGLLAAASATLSHTTSAFTIALTVPLLVLPVVWTGMSPRFRVMTLGGVLALVTAMWSLRPTGMLEVANTPAVSLSEALARLGVTLVPVGGLGWPVLGGITLAAFAFCRRRDLAWIPAVLLAAVLASSLLSAAPPHIRSTLIWPWWGDVARFTVVAALPAVLVLVLAAQAWARWVSGRGGSLPLVVPSLAVGLLGVMGLVNFASVHTHYHPPERSLYWISAADQLRVASLSKLIPEDAVVAADPYSGGTHVYLDRNVTLLFPTEWSPTKDPLLELIGQRLDTVVSDPAICAAVRQRKVDYVLTGPPASAWAGADNPRFAGLDRVSARAGFREVATEGEFRLWRVPDCSEH